MFGVRLNLRETERKRRRGGGGDGSPGPSDSTRGRRRRRRRRDDDDSDEDNDNDDSGEKADNKISDAASLFSDISTGVQDYEKAMYVDAVRARIEAYVPRHGAASTSDVAGQVPDTRTAKQHTVRRKARVHQRLPDDLADAR